MTEPSAVHRGSVLVHVDRRDPAFRRTLAIGPVLTDPGNGLPWVPLVRPDGTADLVEFTSIVDVPPDGAPCPLRVGDPHGPVGVLATALERLVAGLTCVDRDNDDAISGLLDAFVRAVAPVESALCLLAESDPDSGLGAVLGAVCRAGNDFDAGNRAEGVSGMLIADSALRRTLVGGAAQD